MPLVKLQPPTPRSRVKYSTTETDRAPLVLVGKYGNVFVSVDALHPSQQFFSHHDLGRITLESNALN